MKLIVITPEESMPEEVFLIQRMLANENLFRIHIRRKGWSYQEMETFLAQFSTAERLRMSLHSHYTLGVEAGIGGIHFPSTVSLEERNRLQQENDEASVLYSASCHTFSDLLDCSKLAYVFLSPIFNSISKSIVSSFVLAEVQRVLSEQLLPVFALGGVSPARLPAIRAAGFAGAALLGSIWQAADPCEQFRMFASYEETYETLCS